MCLGRRTITDSCTLRVDIATSKIELSNFHASTTPVQPSQLPVSQVFSKHVQYHLRFQMPLLIAGSSLPIKPGPRDSPHATSAPGTSHWPPPFNEDNKNEYPLLFCNHQKHPPKLSALHRLSSLQFFLHFKPACILVYQLTFIMEPEDLSWNSLKITSTADKDQTRLLLLKMLDDAGLLTQSTRSLTDKKCLADELKRTVPRMPGSIRQAFASNPSTCIESLAKLAVFCKHSDIHKFQYYEKTASRLLRDEYFYIVDIDSNFQGPFLLSDLLRDESGLYSDGTIEERLLDFNKFLKCLYKCNFNPFRHEVSLWYAETSSDGIFEGVETNPVLDYVSWISAMIEEQNALQDVPVPFEFHITDPGGCSCDYDFDCDWASDADSTVRDWA